MTEITKTEAIGKLIALAKEVEINESIDWNSVNVTEDQAYEIMAGSVIDQMISVPDEYKEGVMMATMIKLLVENLVLNLKLEEERKKNATSTNRN